ncbi:MAG: D-2-hydroxyacid dehydrogenase [Lachnospiraceae bacterium]|nr:D-2-hydroxyacid dehydrogenase [Lachnospiraceae bacterium]
MKVIVLSSELQQKHLKLIKETAEKIGADVCFAVTEDDIPEDYKDAEILYGFGMRTAARSKQLKWLCVPSAGVEYLFKPGTFANEDCIITNSAGAFGVSIAEHIIMVSLMMMRKMMITFRRSISGEWGDRLPQKSLKDCRITVLGTGDIGCCFARRAKAFEPKKLIGICRSGMCDEAAFDEIIKSDDMDRILPETDLLIMCLPATAETKGILSEGRISMLPSDSYVVNVGRGSAIDEDALADALDENRLAGAALDVFLNEPLPESSRLWTTKNLLITPHVAGNLTIDYTIDKNVEMFCEDLINYANGRSLEHLVDKIKGY